MTGEALVVGYQAGGAVVSAKQVAAVVAAVDASVAPTTAAAYDRAWAAWTTWCLRSGYSPLPAEPLTLAAWITELAATVADTGGRAYGLSSWRLRVAAVNAAHRAAGHPEPGRDDLVRRTISGLRRLRPTRPRQVPPLRLKQLHKIVSAARTQAATGPLRARLAERRDSCMLLAAYFGGCRESELVGLSTGDAVVDDQAPDRGVLVTVRVSKTDQEGDGKTFWLPRRPTPADCPMCALVRWREVLDIADTSSTAATAATVEEELEVAAIAVGRFLHTAPVFTGHVCDGPLSAPPVPELPLFRPFDARGQLTGRPMHRESFRAMLRARAGRADLPAGLVASLGGHSPRAAFITEATEAGASDAEIIQQTGQSPATLTRYRRSAKSVGNAVNRL